MRCVDSFKNPNSSTIWEWALLALKIVLYGETVEIDKKKLHILCGVRNNYVLGHHTSKFAIDYT